VVTAGISAPQIKIKGQINQAVNYMKEQIRGREDSFNKNLLTVVPSSGLQLWKVKGRMEVIEIKREQFLCVSHLGFSSTLPRLLETLASFGLHSV
jgi:hypothetical protein